MYESQALLVAINLGATSAAASMPATMSLQQIQCPGQRNGRIAGNVLELPAHAVIYAAVADPAHA